MRVTSRARLLVMPKDRRSFVLRRGISGRAGGGVSFSRDVRGAEERGSGVSFSRYARAEKGGGSGVGRACQSWFCQVLPLGAGRAEGGALPLGGVLLRTISCGTARAGRRRVILGAGLPGTGGDASDGFWVLSFCAFALLDGEGGVAIESLRSSIAG